MDQQLVQWLGERLDKLDSKLDSLAAAMARVDATLVDHAEDIKALRADVDPIKAHVQQARGVAWVIGMVGAALGVFMTVKQLLG